MKILIVSHGELSKSLSSSAQMIVGKQKDIQSFGLYPKDDVSSLRAQICHELDKFEPHEEILCFTDLFHGSPFNIVVSIMNDYPIFHLTGVNLPILLEGILLRNNEHYSCQNICEKLIEQSRSTIVNVNEYLQTDLNE